MADRALIYGTIALDTLITPEGKACAVLGGSGSYAALAARLVTDQMDLIGVVGDDFPAHFSHLLEDRGVSLRHVARQPGQTFAWTGCYEKDMNCRTTLSTTEGVQETWKMNLPPELQRHTLAVATNVTPRLQNQMLEQCRVSCFSMADSMSSWIQREPEYTTQLMRRVNLMLLNDEEACLLSRARNPIEAGYCLLENGAKALIVKHGSNGSTLFHRGNNKETHLFRCPAWPLAHPKDPTGAGDAYMGALAGYLVGRLNDGHPHWDDLKHGMAIATIIAAATCEEFGTTSLLRLNREEVNHRLAAFHSMTRWD